MLDAALDAAREAGTIQLASRGQRWTQFDKDQGASFATEVDHRCERVIIDRLATEFPAHAFLAEESGASGSQAAEYTWIIDPLDGTISYVSGQPYFAVSIGLLRDRVPMLGVINLPAFGAMYWATRGGGAFRDGTPIRVSAERDLRRAVVGLDLPDLGKRAAEIRSLSLPIADFVRFAYVFGGAAANLAFVAEGKLEAYAHTASPWDFAAGVVLVTEAGGRVTTPRGEALDWSSRRLDLVATNGALHVPLLARFGAKRRRASSSPTRPSARRRNSRRRTNR
jgi:myo-inositol-1(or 4)-monophosphatase